MTTKKEKTHPLQRAWAAGVIDARGGIAKMGANVFRLDSVDQPLIERLHRVMGVGRIKSRKHKNRPHLIWTWETTSLDDMREALLVLLPFLSAHRLKEAGTVLARIEKNPHWLKKHPEKAASLVSARVPTQDAEAPTQQPTTTTDGSTASPAETTTAGRTTAPLDQSNGQRP